MKIARLAAFAAIALATLPCAYRASACTGITLHTADSSTVFARTIEWGGSVLHSGRVAVPRGHIHQSMLPGGAVGGLRFTARYGYVGLTVEQKEFVTEGLNEAGLSAGLFYFPGYGSYAEYDPSDAARTISDFQLVSWILSSFATVDEVREAIDSVTVVGIDPRSSTVHWRVGDRSGREIVIEIIGGTAHVYDNHVGVLTNSPGFEWHVTNLNNYVNLRPGTASQGRMGDTATSSFGAGSAFLGLPGDVTPPSRFVRAAFYKATAPTHDTADEAVIEAFHILNNFDIPIGVEHADGKVPDGLPSATQWTTCTDVTGGRLYYRTAWCSTIRCMDISGTDFEKIKYSYTPLDDTQGERIEQVKL